MADFGPDIAAALTRPETRALLREIIREALHAELAELKAAQALSRDAAASNAERMLTAEQMARRVGVCRATFFLCVAHHQELKALQRSKRWPERQVVEWWQRNVIDKAAA